jgi:hypothetical protein
VVGALRCVWKKSFLQDTDGREETCEGLAPWARGGLGSENDHVVRSTR